MSYYPDQQMHNTHMYIY